MSEWLNIVIVGLLGLAVGSFVNVVADRLPAGKSLVSPPSHCPACDTKLKVIDLIPVLSYLGLRGKCRKCSARIPFRVFLVELATGATFAAIWWWHGPTFEGFALLGYVTLFLTVFLIDLEHHIIPNVIVFPALVLALAASAFLPGVGIVNAGIGAGAGFGIMLALYLIPGMVIGEGDVKLAAVIGAATGFPVVFFGLAASFILGGLVAATLLIVKIRNRKDAIAFGPYMALAAVFTLVWGESAMSWYLDTFWPF